MTTLSPQRVKQILAASRELRVLVVGDVMLDQFIWGNVARISPEAPVPVVDFQRESFMPGGAANVGRNLTSLRAFAEMFGVVGRDEHARKLKTLLGQQNVMCDGLQALPGRATSVKTRIIAHQQQVVRVDRETRGELSPRETRALLSTIKRRLKGADAVIVGDYGKGVVTQPLLDALRRLCRKQGLWLSLDPKPVHHLDLRDMSLITPNRKEAFELADLADTTRASNPLEDAGLRRVVDTLMAKLKPALLLITLGDQGMLLCPRERAPFHIPTVAQEVFDVSGAGDTVIASFTLAIAAGASPVEAAVFSNHAASVVVGKVGTATVTPDELMDSFKRFP